MLDVDAKGEGSRFWFRFNLIVDCLLFLFCELWMKGLVLPSFLNSDNGGTSEVDGGGGFERSEFRQIGGGWIEDDLSCWF